MVLLLLLVEEAGVREGVVLLVLLPDDVTGKHVTATRPSFSGEGAVADAGRVVALTTGEHVFDLIFCACFRGVLG